MLQAYLVILIPCPRPDALMAKSVEKSEFLILIKAPFWHLEETHLVGFVGPEMLQAFLLGIMVAWTPSLIAMTWLCWRASDEGASGGVF